MKHDPDFRGSFLYYERQVNKDGQTGECHNSSDDRAQAFASRLLEHFMGEVIHCQILS